MKIPPLQIGNVTIAFPFLLAPMAGYTDRAFRSICTEFGCGMTFTEVVNAQALLYSSKLTFHMLETLDNEHPISAHLYGSDAGILAEAATIVEKLQRFDTIDINCGCPVRKIVSKGSGAALMKDPEKIESIVRAVCEATSLPVTIKTRIGLSPDTINIHEIADAAEKGGASAISIHARDASAKHSGPANWDLLAAIKAAVGIPVIGNGGIDKSSDALEMMRQTGVDGVMIGRLAVGSPWIFSEIASLISDETPRVLSTDERREVILEHLDRLTVLKEMERKCRRRRDVPVEASTALHFRAHLYQYMKGSRNWRNVRLGLRTMTTRKLVEEALTCL